jgi:hypothetical protein
MEIITFEKRFGHDDHRAIAARFPSSLGDLTMPSGVLDMSVEPLVPQVLQSRWVVHCPTGWCSGAEVMSEDGLFFCCECRNVTVSHAYLRVAVPDPAVRADVEALLLERIDPSSRNYVDGDTPQSLEAENAAELGDDA